MNARIVIHGDNADTILELDLTSERFGFLQALAAHTAQETGNGWGGMPYISITETT